MDKHILYINSWYPISTNPSHGIFFKRHAEAAALKNKISAIYVHSHPLNKGITITNDNNVFTIISTYKKVQNAVPIVSNFIKIYRSLQAFKAAYSELVKEQRKPDLAQLNIIFPAGIFVLWLFYTQKIPYIIQEQWSGYYPEDGNYRGFFTKLITQKCAEHAKAILVVSQKLKASMLGHGLKNNYLIIGNAVDENLFKPIEKKISSPFKFIHVSSVNDKEKNISGIIQACHLVATKTTNFKLHIVGNSNEINHFSSLASELGLLNNQIFFDGFQMPNQVATMMAEADCFILFSNYEGLPCVLLEAMSCGIPIISTKVGAVPEIITDKLGYLIDINNQVQLSEKMLDMINEKSNFDSNYISQYTQARYSYKALSIEFDDIYTQVLNN